MTMKKITSFIAILAVGAGILTGGIRDSNMAFMQAPPDYYDVKFITPMTGFICGTGGTVLRTDNGGENWTKQSTGVTTTLNRILPIHSPTDGVITAYAIGASKTLIKTTDGGTTWSNVAGNLPGTGTMPAAVNIKGIAARSTSELWICGTLGGSAAAQVYRTTDSGASWQTTNSSLATIDFNSIHSFSSWEVGSTCLIIGGVVSSGKGAVYVSTSGANSWTNYSPNAALSGNVTQIASLDGNNAVILSDVGEIRTAYAPMVNLVRSVSAWYTVESYTTNALRAASQLLGDRGLIVGDSGTVLWRTTPPGVAQVRYTNNASGLTTNINGAALPGRETAIIVGNAGTILKSKTTTPWEILQDGFKSFHGINGGSYYDATNDAIVVGNKGFHVLINDGNTATINHPSMTPYLGTIDEDLYGGTQYQTTVYVVGKSGYFARGSTASTGPRYRTRVPGVTGTLRALSAVYFAPLFIAGDGGVIKKSNENITTNADVGYAWTDISLPTASDVHTIYRISNTLALVGATGKIYRSTNEGTAWTDVTPAGNGSSEIVKAISNVVNSQQYAVNSNGEVYNSTDSGVTWGTTASTGVTASLNSVLQVSTSASTEDVLVVGNAGTILRTTDRGVTWENLTSQLGNIGDYVLVYGNATTGIGIAASNGTLVRSGSFGSTPFYKIYEDRMAAEKRGLNDNSTNLTVGNDGIIYTTTDSGVSWKKAVVEEGSPYHLNSVSQTGTWTPGTSGIAIAVGSEGRIKVTTNGGNTWNNHAMDWTGLAHSQVSIQSSTEALIATIGPSILQTSGAAISSSSIWQKIGGWGDIEALAVRFVGNNGVFLGDRVPYRTAGDSPFYSLVPCTDITSNISNLSLTCAHFPSNSVGYMGLSSSGNVLKTTDTGATWAFTTGLKSETAKANDIFFINTTTGWCRADDSVDYTTDGGATWAASVGALATGGNRAIHFADANTGWTIGSSSVYKSTNGGANWAAQTEPYSFTLHSIYAVDTNTVYVCGDDSSAARAVGKTTNGGTTWVEFDGTSTGVGLADGKIWNSIWFVNASIGWVVSNDGLIYRTTNGGTNWAAQGPNPVTNSPALLRVRMGIGGTPGTDDFGWVTGKAGHVLYTTDSGTTWSIRTSSPYTTGSGTNMYEMAHTGSGSSTVIFASDATNTAKTTDNGATWTSLTPGNSGSVNHIHMLSSSIVFIVDNGGGIVRTTNGGTNWGERNTIGGNTTPINAIHVWDRPFSANDIAIAVGNGGKIFISTNAGITSGAETWGDRTSSSFTANLKSVYIYDTDEAIAVGDDGTVYSIGTTDGNDWDPLTITPIKTDFYGATFWDSGRGWICGERGTIWATNGTGDHEKRWVVQSSGTSAALNGMFATDLNTVFACGNAQTLIKTTNGGTTWASSNTGMTGGTDINAVLFKDSSNGWAVAEGGYIHRTTNGGANWSSTDTGTIDLYSIARSPTTGRLLAVGSSSGYFYSTNDGATWTSPADTLPVTTTWLSVSFGSDGDAIAVAIDNSTAFYNGSTNTWSAGGNLVGQGWSCLKINNTRAYAVDGGGRVYLSTNEGTTWTQIPSGTTKFLRVITSPYKMGSGTEAFEDAIYIAGHGVIRASFTKDLRFEIVSGTALGNSSVFSPSTNSFTAGSLRRVSIDSSGNGVAVTDSGTSYSIKSWKPDRSVEPTYSYQATAMRTAASAPSGPGYIVGNNGRIWKTDGTIYNSPVREDLHGVCYDNSSLWWVCGERGMIMSTPDFTTYTTRNSGVTSLLRDIYFTSSTTGFVCGDSGSILKTTDSGVTWNAVTVSSPGAMYRLYFLSSDASKGWAAGFGYVWRTVDSGANWTRSNAITGCLGWDIAFTDANNGYMVGFSFGTSIAHPVYKSTNGGVDWNPINTPSATTTPQWFGISMPTNTDIVVCGEGLNMARSWDGGTNWTIVSTSHLTSLSHVKTDDTLWVAGVSFLGSSTSGGYTLQGRKTTKLINPDIMGVYGFSSSRAFAIRRPGNTNNEISETIDTGTTWTTRIAANSSNFWKAIHFSGSTGLACKYDGAGSPTAGIAYSTDGGVNWGGATGVPSGLTCYDVFLVNSTIGWSVADGKYIIKTTNGGANWSTQQTGSILDPTLYSVMFADTNYGWTVGTGGTIYATTNGGTNWATQTSGTTLDLHDVYVLDKNIVWIVGKNGTVLRTMNGGTNWDKLGVPTNRDLWSIVFANEDQGWISGSDGLILKTEVAGFQWRRVNADKGVGAVNVYTSTGLLRFTRNSLFQAMQDASSGDILEPASNSHVFDEDVAFPDGKALTMRKFVFTGHVNGSADGASTVDTLYNCLIFGSIGRGLLRSGGTQGSSFVAGTDKIYNCTLLRDTLYGHPTFNGRINSTSDTEDDGVGNGTGSSTFQNNIVCNNSGANGLIDATYKILRRKHGASGWASIFVNTFYRDYHLNATATDAINQGNTIAGIEAKDFDGQIRPEPGGTVWDIGFDEYVSSNVILTAVKGTDGTSDIDLGDLPAMHQILSSVTNSGATIGQALFVPSKDGTLYLMDSANMKVIDVRYVDDTNATVLASSSAPTGGSRKGWTTTQSGPYYPILSVFAYRITTPQLEWRIFLLVDTNNDGLADAIQFVLMANGDESNPPTFSNVTPVLTAPNSWVDADYPRSYHRGGSQSDDTNAARRDRVLRIPSNDGAARVSGMMSSLVIKRMIGEIDSSAVGTTDQRRGRRLFVVSNNDLYKFNIDPLDTTNDGANSPSVYGEMIWKIRPTDVASNFTKFFNWHTPMSLTLNDKLYVGLIEAGEPNKIKNYLLARVNMGGTSSGTVELYWSSHFGENENRYGHFQDSVASVSNIYVAPSDGSRLYGIRSDAASDTYRFVSNTSQKKATSLPMKLSSSQAVFLGTENLVQKCIDKGDGDSNTGKLAQNGSPVDSDWPLGSGTEKITGNVLRFLILRDAGASGTKLYFATDEGYVYCWRVDKVSSQTAGDETIVDGFPIRVPGKRITSLFGWFSGTAAGLYISTTAGGSGGGLFKIPWQ